MKRATTLADVARAAGVSKGTAGNVFSRPELVGAGLRERVEAAAHSLGYAGPDPKGRVLSSGKVNAVGVVMPGAYPISIAFRHPYMRDFLAGVTDVCDEHGAGLSLVSGIDDQKAWGIRNALVDGLIFGRIEEVDLIEHARRRRLPFVVMDADGGADVSSVRIDDRGGARQAAQHLVDLGHRRFAIVSVMRQSGRGPILHGKAERPHDLVAGYPMDRERLHGCAEVFASIGISIDEVPIVEINSNEGVSEGASLLLDRAPEATAVLCMGDPQALGVLDEARRRNIAVPRDLSVVGFDDSPEAVLAEPPLTTVAQPVVEKGRVAARMLFDGGPPRHVVLPVSLIVRGSTAPPRA
jgi:DNA-binding LacI/PurR family transcriptional regulator